MAVLQKIESWVEGLLWGSRRAMILAVIACMVAFFSILLMTVIEVFHVVTPVLTRFAHLNFGVDTVPPGEKTLHEKTLQHVVGLVDSFLVAIFLLVFAYGMYELFVSKLDPARKEERQSKGDTAILGLLSIRNLDDLKSNLVKVITAILIVTLFENAVAIDIDTPIELVYFAATILLIALALYVIHLASNLRPGRDKSSLGPEEDSPSPVRKAD
jgi:uncharacterized membrane protein YqhA